MAHPEREWTLEAARALLPDVRRLTEDAVESIERLLERRDASEPESEERVEIEAAIRGEAGRWARAMEALGAEVKGLWLVDFDNGSGFYCWRWPEERLEYFHGYEEGFAGRTRIQ